MRVKRGGQWSDNDPRRVRDTWDGYAPDGLEVRRLSQQRERNRQESYREKTAARVRAWRARKAA